MGVTIATPAPLKIAIFYLHFSAQWGFYHTGKNEELSDMIKNAGETIRRRSILQDISDSAPSGIRMTVIQLLTVCPRFDLQKISSFGVLPFPFFSSTPAVSKKVLINHATSISIFCSITFLAESVNPFIPTP
jgi:hypothetical protein